jgi:hypothetical protein
MRVENHSSYPRVSSASPHTQGTATRYDTPTSELTAQEKLRIALEEKQWLTDGIRSEFSAAEPELGKNLDLRV